MMELKTYQIEALDRFDRWWEELNKARTKSDNIVAEYAAGLQIPDDVKNYPRVAWDVMVKKNNVANPEYVDRSDGAGRPIPHVCLKIPTGGGKTLVAAAVLERLSLRSGFVLWVVPTNQIYNQTYGALKNRESPIWQRLDHGSGSRMKLVKKDEPLNMYDAEQHLCVMPLMLGGVNRKKNKDFLLMNRPSGAYTSFFPEPDDDAGNAELLRNNPDLEVQGGMAMHSLANVFKMMHPIVILDEAHKAYGGKGGQEYAGMINRLNPSLVVELSATPNQNISNLLVDVSGSDLRAEQMIKMSIDLKVQSDDDWEHILHDVSLELKKMETDAESLRYKKQRYIRPIALVRVERTGKDKRDGVRIHVEDVREYLIQKLGVPPQYIAIQSSEQKELDGIDLMSESTQIRWIITKSALQEGWDCPFAYVLAILDSVKAPTAVTQLIGRVLRQPEAAQTEIDSLDRCYVYCSHPDTGQMANFVRAGLSKIGMNDIAWTVTSGDTKSDSRVRKRLRRSGPVFLPSVLHRDSNDWVRLEYERHILSGVDFAAILAPDPKDFNHKEHGWSTLTIKVDDVINDIVRFDTHEKASTLRDFALPLIDIIPNVWQAARVAQEFMAKLRDSGKTESEIYNAMPYLVKVLRDSVTEAVDQQARQIFLRKIKAKKIRFDLEMGDRNYWVKTYDVAKGKLLAANDGRQVQRTLFEPTYEEEFDTELERGFARYLDASETVDWWHRVAAGQRDSYHIMGWKKNRIYPDFIVQYTTNSDKVRLGIYDTKGEHLRENPDTKYKEEVLKELESAFNCGTVRVKGGQMRGKFQLVFDNKFEETGIE